MNLQQLLRAQIGVLVLAALGIGLFLLIYFLMGDSAAPAARLFTALCVPPLVLAVVAGFWVLARKR